MPTGINQCQLIERVLIQTDDARHGTHVLCERAELPLQKYARDPSFFIRPVRYVVLEPPGEIRRSSPARRHTSFFVRAARCVVLEPPGEIRRSLSAWRDPTFFYRPVRYDVLLPRGEIHRSSTARWDTTFFSRTQRYDLLPLSRRYVRIFCYYFIIDFKCLYYIFNLISTSPQKYNKCNHFRDKERYKV